MDGECDALQQEVDDKLDKLRELETKIKSAAQRRELAPTGGGDSTADDALKAAQRLMVDLTGLQQRMAAELQHKVAATAGDDRGDDERDENVNGHGDTPRTGGTKHHASPGTNRASDNGATRPCTPRGRPRDLSETALALRLLEWLDGQMRQMPYTTPTITKRVCEDDVLHAAFCAKGGVGLLVRDLSNTSYIGSTVEGIEMMCRDTGTVDPARGHGTVSSFAMCV